MVSMTAKNTFTAVVLLCCACGLVACSDKKAALDSEPSLEQSDVLVTVNGQAITSRDLARTTEKLFASPAAQAFALDIEAKALESMVMMTVIAQASAGSLDQESIADIDSKVARYREELLVESYLRVNADVTPPTRVEIEQFYNDNLEAYGKKTIRKFTAVRAKNETAESDKLKLTQALNDFRAAPSWDKQISASANGFALEIVAGSTDLPGMDAALLNVVNSLDKSETSKVVYVSGKPQVIRVNNVLELQAQPLNEVEASIRKTLAARKLKNQLRDMYQKLKESANIVYSE